MKNLLSIVVFCILIVSFASSCQKKYERSDLAPTTGTNAGGTPGLLIKLESKTAGSSEASTTNYKYDAASRLTGITSVDIDSANKSTTTFYNYTRDALGRITKIATNVLAAASPGAGFPDTLLINVHYPNTGTPNFDYSTYTVALGGVTYKDSVAYVYTNGIITEQAEYQGLLPSTGMTMVVKLQYLYKNSNVVAEKLFDPSVSTGTPAYTYTYDYDTRVSPLYTGNEGFLAGQNSGFASKNNVSKITINDNTNGSVVLSLSYTLQYNATNVPVSASVVALPVNKTTTVTFTYQ